MEGIPHETEFIKENGPTFWHTDRSDLPHAGTGIRQHGIQRRAEGARIHAAGLCQGKRQLFHPGN